MRKVGIVCVAMSLFAREAWAFRTASDSTTFAGDAKIRWAQDDIKYEIDPNGPDGITAADFEAATNRAFAKWSKPACSNVRFLFQGQAAAPGTPGDRVNTVQWVSSGWAAHGVGPSAAAVTDVQYEKADDGSWRIVEADLYLNAENHRWILSGAPNDGVTRDLDSVLTHEAGHMLGLLHPCEVGGGVDGAPDCASSPAFAETTMYPVYNPSQANLSTDDIVGACYLYPSLDCDGPRCSADSGCPNDPCNVTDSDAGADCQPSEPCAPLEGGISSDGARGVRPVQCSTDEGCGPGKACATGQCAAPGESGDVCTVDSDCRSGFCVPAGYCANGCASAGDCSVSEDCVVSNGDRGFCQPSLSPMGTTCRNPEQCVGHECITHEGWPSLCTRDCDSEHPCPFSWECTPIEGAMVCRPPLPSTFAASGAACTILPSSGHQFPFSGEVPVAGFALAAIALSGFRSRNRSLFRVRR